MREESPAKEIVEDGVLDAWFCREVLPLEPSLAHFLRRNWRIADDVADLTHDVYELALSGARRGLPINTRPYLFTVARNHLINLTKRARIVSFEHVADLEALPTDSDCFQTDARLTARDELRNMLAGLEKLSPRVREIVELRKIEGLSPQETADRLGIGKDAVNGQLVMGMKALADHMLGGSGRIKRPRYRDRLRKTSP